MKTLKKLLFLSLAFNSLIYAAEVTQTCNPALANELNEISKKQNDIIGDDKKALTELEEKRKSLEAEKVALLSIRKLQDEFRSTLAEIEKLNKLQYLNEDAISLMRDIEKHINNVAAHQSLKKILDQMGSENDQSVFMEFVKAKKANGETANSINPFVDNFYNHMKNCDPKKSTQCKVFSENFKSLEVSNVQGPSESNKAIIDESKIKAVIDNYGDLLYYITEGKGTSSKKFQEAINKHNSILSSDDLLSSKVSIFEANSDQKALETLMNLYRETSTKDSQGEIDAKLRVGSTFLNDAEISTIQEAMKMIDGPCKVSTASCEKLISENNGAKNFSDVLKKLNEKMEQKTGKKYNLDEGVFSKNSQASKAEFYQKIDSIFKRKLVAFDNEGVPKEVREVCGPIQNIFDSPFATTQYLDNEDKLKTNLHKCLKELEQFNINETLNKNNKDIAELDNSVKAIINKPEFKQLEILKAALFDQYNNQCASTVGDDTEVPKCGLTLFDHSKTVDRLSLEIQEAGKNIEVRNYLKYLGFSDGSDKFSDPSYWAKILREQCNGYSESRAKEIDEETQNSEDECGFSSCNACNAIAQFGKNSVIRQESMQYEDLPMHQYREYDRQTGRMVKKRHPIGSLAAHTLKYAAMNMSKIGAPLIATKRLQGNLWSMEQNALYNKQSIHWNNQYKTQMYNQLDLRNPNLFGNYLSSNSTMGFPVN